jgi:hypothetical protein
LIAKGTISSDSAASGVRLRTVVTTSTSRLASGTIVFALLAAVDQRRERLELLRPCAELDDEYVGQAGAPGLVASAQERAT